MDPSEQIKFDRQGNSPGEGSTPELSDATFDHKDQFHQLCRQVADNFMDVSNFQSLIREAAELVASGEMAFRPAFQYLEIHAGGISEHAPPLPIPVFQHCLDKVLPTPPRTKGDFVIANFRVQCDSDFCGWIVQHLSKDLNQESSIHQDQINKAFASILESLDSEGRFNFVQNLMDVNRVMHIPNTAEIVKVCCQYFGAQDTFETLHSIISQIDNGLFGEKKGGAPAEAKKAAVRASVVFLQLVNFAHEASGEAGHVWHANSDELPLILRYLPDNELPLLEAVNTVASVEEKADCLERVALDIHANLRVRQNALFQYASLPEQERSLKPACTKTLYHALGNKDPNMVRSAVEILLTNQIYNRGKNREGIGRGTALVYQRIQNLLNGKNCSPELISVLILSGTHLPLGQPTNQSNIGPLKGLLGNVRLEKSSLQAALKTPKRSLSHAGDLGALIKPHQSLRLCDLIAGRINLKTIADWLPEKDESARPWKDLTADQKREHNSLVIFRTLAGEAPNWLVSTLSMLSCQSGSLAKKTGLWGGVSNLSPGADPELRDLLESPPYTRPS